MVDLEKSEVQFALQAVSGASLLVQQVQAELATEALSKQDRSPVTVADFASQAFVGRMLGEAFPGDPLVAEEESSALCAPDSGLLLAQVVAYVKQFIPGADAGTVCGWIDHRRVDTAPRFWTLDPIDGTKGFLRGDQYVVALALIEDGQVQLGVLGCPNLRGARSPENNGQGSLVLAQRGAGAWTRPLRGEGVWKALYVSDRVEPGRARLLSSFESGHTNVDQIDHFTQALGMQVEPLRMDSQAKYALLAAGAGELYLRLLSPALPGYREKIWDQAAGSMILEEAGGRITDLDGNPLDFTQGRRLECNRGMLASNGLLHEAALEAVRKIGA